MIKSKGKITIEPGTNVWPHELKTAQALAAVGYNVDFIKPTDMNHIKTADTFINGMYWEFKSPRSTNIKAIERNLRRGLEQADCIVFDRRRMKNISDAAIERELHICANSRIKKLKHLLFINRKGDVIDIK